ncbi:MAG: hypothetical protein QNJ97_27380 [Myxococcota bacterium]|nr:hypothetical protein [Myxococcota bacterium]
MKKFLTFIGVVGLLLFAVECENTESSDPESCDPVYNWAYTPLHIGRLELENVLVREDGFTYAVGYFDGEMTFGEGESALTLSTEAVDDDFLQNGYITGFDKRGERVWTVQFAPEVWLTGADLTPGGDLLIAGRLSGATSFGQGSDQIDLEPVDTDDIFLARYRTDGTLVWASRASGDGEAVPNRLLAGDDGSMLLIGSYKGDAEIGIGDAVVILDESDDDFLTFHAKFNSAGEVAWARTDQGLLAPTADGTSLVSGTFVDTIVLGEGDDEVTLIGASGNPTMYLASYGQDGTLNWARVAGANVFPHAFAQLTDGTISLIGVSYGPEYNLGEGDDAITIEAPGAYNLALARYLADGTLLAGERAAAADSLELFNGYDLGRSYQFCDDGVTYLTAIHSNNLMIGYEEVEVPETFAAQPSFVARYGADCSVDWFETGHEQIADIASACKGQLAIIGTRVSEPWSAINPYAVVFDEMGSRIWESLPGQIGNRQGLRAGALDDGSTLLVTLERIEPFWDECSRIARFDPMGMLEWNKQLAKPFRKATLSRYEHLFYPPTKICEPSNVSLYAFEDQIDAFLSQLRATAMAWIDSSGCVTPCAEMGNYEECLEANCTTGSGAVIDYYYTVDYEETTSSEVTRVDKSIGYHIVVALPVGAETWSKIEFDSVASSQSHSSFDHSWGSRNNSYTVSWQGAIDSNLPADRDINASFKYEWSECGQSEWDWQTDGMSLNIKEFNEEISPVEFRIVLNGDVIESRFASEWDWRTGWINNTCVGLIDHKTWEIIGECDSE